MKTWGAARKAALVVLLVVYFAVASYAFMQSNTGPICERLELHYLNYASFVIACIALVKPCASKN